VDERSASLLCDIRGSRSEVAGKGIPRFFRLLLVCFLCCACTRLFIGQSAAAPSTATPAPVSQIRGPNQRPAVMLGEAEGLIHLDVLVTDNSGRPVPGLGAKDFTLVDNGRIEKDPFLSRARWCLAQAGFAG
jgi:hypothetical protein